MAKRSLATLFSRPCAVTLAGRTYLIEELTIGDMADLHAAEESRRADPLESVRDLISAPYVAPADRARIAEAYDRAAGDATEDGGEVDDPGAATVRRMFSLIAVCLRRHHPDVVCVPGKHPEIDGAAVVGIVGSVTAAEYAVLEIAAYRPEPLALLMHTIDRLAGTLAEEQDDGGPDWHEWVDRVSRSHGMSYPAIRAMTRTQFFVALAEGRCPEGRDARPGEDAIATSRRWRAWFAGEDPT